MLVFLMSLMSLAHKSDISDMAFLLVITRGGIVNQSVVVSVQSVQWDGELENNIFIDTICHSDDRREEESRQHNGGCKRGCYRDSSLRSE